MRLHLLFHPLGGLGFLLRQPKRARGLAQEATGKDGVLHCESERARRSAPFLPPLALTPYPARTLTRQASAVFLLNITLTLLLSVKKAP